MLGPLALLIQVLPPPSELRNEHTRWFMEIILFKYSYLHLAESGINQGFESLCMVQIVDTKNISTCHFT